MVLRLDTISRKLLIVLLSVLASATVGFVLLTHVRAEEFSRAGTLEAMEQALALQPRKAEFHNRLGRILLYSPAGDAARGMALLTRATELSAHRASFWLDLSLAHELRGDAAAAERLLERARRAEPQTPRVLWHEANFLLRRGQPERALELSRELYAMAPEYGPRLLPLLSRVVDVETLIERVVPRHREAHNSLLEFLSREETLDPRGAALAWQRVEQLNQPVPQFLLRLFLDSLLRGRQARLAAQVWRDAALRGWIPVPADALEQSFYNADFRYPPLNFGFDWRVLPHPEASVWIEPSGPEPGQQSLCVQFAEAARAAYFHVTRYLSVEPDRRYLLRAQVRTDRLLSRTGAYFEVKEMAAAEPSAGARAARSHAWIGTTRWRQTSVEFATGPATELVSLTLHRPAPRADEPAAIGQVCMAQFELQLLGGGRAVPPVRVARPAPKETE